LREIGKRFAELEPFTRDIVNRLPASSTEAATTDFEKELQNKKNLLDKKEKVYCLADLFINVIFQ
jgi:hypothetical protein